jgi:hypothetical protein
MIFQTKLEQKMDGQISIVWRKGNRRFFLQLSPNTGRVCAFTLFFLPTFDVAWCIRATILWRYSGPGVSCILVFQISDIKH